MQGRQLGETASNAGRTERVADRQAESSWGICEVIVRWRQTTCVHGTTGTPYPFKTVETCKRLKVQEYKRLERGRYKGRSDLYATLNLSSAQI